MKHLHDITAVENSAETTHRGAANRQIDRQHLLFKPCQHITISAKQDLWFTNILFL